MKKTHHSQKLRINPSSVFAQVILESGRTMLSLAQLMQIAVLLWTLSLQHLKTFQSFVLVLKDREVQFL